MIRENLDKAFNAAKPVAKLDIELWKKIINAMQELAKVQWEEGFNAAKDIYK